MQLRVSLAFARLPDKELDNFTLGVKDGITGNAAYPTPPVTMVNLETARGDFEQKIAKAAIGRAAGYGGEKQFAAGVARRPASDNSPVMCKSIAITIWRRCSAPASRP